MNEAQALNVISVYEYVQNTLNVQSSTDWKKFDYFDIVFGEQTQLKKLQKKSTASKVN